MSKMLNIQIKMSHSYKVKCIINSIDIIVGFQSCTTIHYFEEKDFLMVLSGKIF